MSTSPTAFIPAARASDVGIERQSPRSRYLDAEIASWVMAQRTEPARPGAVVGGPELPGAQTRTVARRRSRALASTAASLAWSRLGPAESAPWSSRLVPPSGASSLARRAFRAQRVCR